MNGDYLQQAKEMYLGDRSAGSDPRMQTTMALALIDIAETLKDVNENLAALVNAVYRVRA